MAGLRSPFIFEFLEGIYPWSHQGQQAPRSWHGKTRCSLSCSHVNGTEYRKIVRGISKDESYLQTSVPVGVESNIEDANKISWSVLLGVNTCSFRPAVWFGLSTVYDLTDQWVIPKTSQRNTIRIPSSETTDHLDFFYLLYTYSLLI